MQNFAKDFEDITRQFSRQNYKITQEALEEASKKAAMIFSNSTVAIDTGQFKGAWKYQKYPNVIYIFNDRGVNGYGHGGGIPISNLAEYSKRGPKPFINSTWEKVKHDVLRTFVSTMEQKIRKIK